MSWVDLLETLHYFVAFCSEVLAKSSQGWLNDVAIHSREHRFVDYGTGGLVDKGLDSSPDNFAMALDNLIPGTRLYFKESFGEIRVSIGRALMATPSCNFV